MESSKSDSESPDQAEFRGDNKCAQCMQVLYLQSEQVNGIVISPVDTMIEPPTSPG